LAAGVRQRSDGGGTARLARGGGRPAHSRRGGGRRWRPLRTVLSSPLVALREAGGWEGLGGSGGGGDGGPAAAGGEVRGWEQRGVLRVAAEVAARAGEVVAERPQAATTLVSPLQRAEERVEGGWRALVGYRDQGASRPGGPVAGGLDSRQVGLERCARVVDSVPAPDPRAAALDRPAIPAP